MLGEIFRMGFLVALIMPQTATTISSPSEDCSCKTEGSGYILFSTQNEELAYIRFHNWLTEELAYIRFHNWLTF
eukprot:UN04812